MSRLRLMIEQLERTKEIEENNYKYFQASLEKARVDEALDPAKMPNISVVQSPSIAIKTSRELKKVVLGFAGGGIALGLAFAFLIDLILDRTVKRPLEIEMLLGIRLCCRFPTSRASINGARCKPGFGCRSSKIRRSIPALGAGPFHPHLLRSDSRPPDPLLPPQSTKPQTETRRSDRLFGRGRNLDRSRWTCRCPFGDRRRQSPYRRHEYTGSRGASLLRGAPACSLTEALVGAPAPAGDNLYLAVAASPDAPDAQIIPKKFYDLVPHLKASDFDYIVFDMPPLSETSITLSIAG